MLVMDRGEVIQHGFPSTLTKFCLCRSCWKGKSALDWFGLEPETSDTAVPLGRDASYGNLGRKSRYSELHFLSVRRRKYSDVLVCGTQEALTLVVILKNGHNHWSWMRSWIEFDYWRLCSERRVVIGWTCISFDRLRRFFFHSFCGSI